MTAVLNDTLKKRGVPVHSKALLSGSVMPDVPLLGLSLGYLATRRRISPISAEDQICGPRFNRLYFTNPYWLSAYSLFHAPLHLALLAWTGYQFGLRRGKTWGLHLFWFTLGCGFHILVDILTHHNDGPLLFFPFNRTYRFPAPISYWDPRYGGKIFAPLERLLGLAIVLFLAARWLMRRNNN